MQTAREMTEWTRDHITALSKSPEYGNLARVFARIAAESGLGRQYVANFYYGGKDNPTVDTIDRLVAAIKAMHQDLAA